MVRGLLVTHIFYRLYPQQHITMHEAAKRAVELAPTDADCQAALRGARIVPGARHRDTPPSGADHRRFLTAGSNGVRAAMTKANLRPPQIARHGVVERVLGESVV
jgi:hypothetical protein